MKPRIQQTAVALADRLRARFQCYQEVIQGSRSSWLPLEQLWTLADEAALTQWAALPVDGWDPLYLASQRIAYRLHLWRKAQSYCRERGDEGQDYHPAEIWEAADQAALDAHESAINEITGARPLPFQEIA